MPLDPYDRLLLGVRTMAQHLTFVAEGDVAEVADGDGFSVIVEPRAGTSGWRITTKIEALHEGGLA